jgi:PhzF family phenazine biosynthesis protein
MPMVFTFVYPSHSDLAALKPDFREVARLEARGIICTAPSKEYDFVSRFFAPQLGIDEDPVTGSAHTSLIPYWSNVLNKKEMTAMQISPRGGYLRCKALGERVEISGQAVAFMQGVISI